MPHFVIDCSEGVIRAKPPKEIMRQVFDTALSTGLFGKADIKVRIRPFEYHLMENGQSDFIHVFANIMEGRSTAQKRNLSEGIIAGLKSILPQVGIISINIRDFEKATYCNQSMV